MILSAAPAQLSKHKNCSPLFVVWNSLGGTGIAAMFIGSDSRFLSWHAERILQRRFSITSKLITASSDIPLAAQLKLVGLSQQSPLGAALFPLSILQFRSWFDQVDARVVSSVQQNCHSDPALLLLCNALFFLKRIRKR